jgi:hypothetical protein
MPRCSQAKFDEPGQAAMIRDIEQLFLMIEGGDNDLNQSAQDVSNNGIEGNDINTWLDDAFRGFGLPTGSVLGTMAFQDADAVAIIGGTIDNITLTNSLVASVAITGSSIDTSSVDSTLTVQPSVAIQLASGTLNRVTDVYQDATTFQIEVKSGGSQTAGIAFVNTTGAVVIDSTDYIELNYTAVGGYIDLQDWIVSLVGSIPSIYNTNAGIAHWIGVGNYGIATYGGLYINGVSPFLASTGSAGITAAVDVNLTAGQAAMWTIATTLTQTMGGGSAISSDDYIWGVQSNSTKTAYFNSNGTGSRSRLSFNQTKYLQVATGGITTSGIPDITLTATATATVDGATTATLSWQGTKYVQVDSAGTAVIGDFDNTGYNTIAGTLNVMSGQKFQSGLAAAAANGVTHKLAFENGGTTYYILCSTSAA